jgi:hypothetical protein
MNIKSGIVSAVAGASLVGGVTVAGLLTGGTATVAAQPATMLSTPAVASTPAPASHAAAASAAPANGPMPGPSCDVVKDDGAWPLVADGRPAGLDAGDAAADYIWHDATGWHLRVTHQNDHHQVWTGVITTNGVLSDAAVKLEKNDRFAVGPDKHAITFSFNNYGGIDGLDFRTHCATGIRFDLRADGAPVNPTEVLVGHGGRNPAKIPFAIRRSR